MLKALGSSFKIPELKKKILFTLAMIAVFRLGAYVPTPGVNTQALALFFEKQSGTLFSLMDMFSGGAMRQATVFALGIMPYISASIIMQLLTAVVPIFMKIAKEPDGRKKITQYTRYGTIVLCVIQSLFIASWLEGSSDMGGMGLALFTGWKLRLLVIITLTAGSAFLMWLGEQMSAFGIGNGISIIITAGIISRMPPAFKQFIEYITPFGHEARIKPPTIMLLVIMLIGVIVGVILITQGQRKIPVQYAKRVIGRKIYGGHSSYIPLRVNQAGVIPIIFAQSVLMFPQTIAGFAKENVFIDNLTRWLGMGHPVYIVSFTLLIVFFTYFYTAIIFNPQDVAQNMKKHGGFIPGVRPGKPTEQYFDYILGRITLPGAIFLAGIAVMPTLINGWLKVPYLIASFLGGTGILIIVGVMLDTMGQIESHLLMRHYEGFMKKGKIRTRR
ncbi:MAG: preprotein translocase subunit SecY [Candidatus Omnitrophica bacterium]|nr:preprotein translocase subunit SecY [Candidatus Omnitrophota bacterium]